VRGGNHVACQELDPSHKRHKGRQGQFFFDESAGKGYYVQAEAEGPKERENKNILRRNYSANYSVGHWCQALL
jgi:hypothetical protein